MYFYYYFIIILYYFFFYHPESFLHFLVWLDVTILIFQRNLWFIVWVVDEKRHMNSFLNGEESCSFREKGIPSSRGWTGNFFSQVK